MQPTAGNGLERKDDHQSPPGAVPGLSQVWQISGLIVFVPMRKCWDESYASLGVPGMCLSPLGAMGDLLPPSTSGKPGFVSFTGASAPHPTVSADTVALESGTNV